MLVDFDNRKVDLRNKCISILKNLISFKVLGGDSNASIAEWIETYLKEHNIVFKNVFNEDGSKRSIHCRIGPSTDGGVVLSGHMDVVPTVGQEWSTDPFELSEACNGKIYGRGTCDMKGFIACCLASLSEIMKAELSKPIYFAFSYDEEIGCLAGPALARDIKEYYFENPSIAIIGEPTMMEVAVGQKGIAKFKTKINGSGGHSSRIKAEISAIYEAAKAINWLESRMNKFLTDRDMDDRFDPNHSSIHVGIFDKSGTAANIISDDASFTWEMRNIPRNSVEKVLQEFDEYCKLREDQGRQIFPEFSIRTEALMKPVPALDTSEENEAVGLTLLLANKTETIAVSYAAEAGQFAEAGFNTVICGPGDIAQAHRANEFIELAQLDECLEFISGLIKELS